MTLQEEFIRLTKKYARPVVVYAVIIFLTIEIALRAFAPFSSTVRLMLWARTNGTQYDFIRTTEDIARFVPTMSAPFSYHAGYQLDRHGFWTEPYTQAKKPGVLRMVDIGDSFTFSSGGVPRPLLWHQVAAKMLSGALRMPVEDINLGLPGAGPRLTRRVLQVEGVHLHPDIVVYGLFLGNDFTDERESRSWLTKASYAARFLGSLPRLPAQLRTIRANGGLFAMPDPSFAPDRYAYNRGKKTFPDDVFLGIAKTRANLFTASGRAEMSSQISDVIGVIEGMKKDAEAAGARFVVLMIPDELQVNAALRKKVEAMLPGQTIDPDATEQVIAEALHERGIEFVETEYELRREAEDVRSPYGVNDTHWDIRGNEIGGQVIAEYLMEDL